MRDTRYPSRPERRAAIGQVLRALVALAVAIAIDANRHRLEEVALENDISIEIADRVVDTAMWIVLGFTAIAAFTALYRAARWIRAARWERMLADPKRAALVPPLEGHLQGLDKQRWLGHRPMRRLMFTALLVAAVAGPIVVGDSDSSRDASEEWSGAVIGIAFVAVLLVTSVLGIRAWYRAWRVERLSSAPELGRARAERAAAPTTRSDAIPALTVRFVQYGTTPSRGPDQVTAEQNVFGRPPWRMVYLRLFDNDARLQEFLTGQWRTCGYAYVMRGASSVSKDELERAKDGGAIFINSREWLRAELERGSDAPLPPGTGTFTGIASGPVEVTDPRGSYPVRALLCHGTFWQEALDVLLETVDVVVLDLAGYLRHNRGTGYELQRVVDRFPIERCVLLTDESGDHQFVEAQIHEAWSRMAAGSPNEGTTARAVLVSRTLSGRPKSIAAASALQDQLDAAPRHPTHSPAN